MSKALKYSNVNHDSKLQQEDNKIIPTCQAVKDFVNKEINSIKVLKKVNTSNLYVDKIIDIDSQKSKGKKGTMYFGEKGIYICIKDNFWQKLNYDKWDNVKKVTKSGDK